MSFASSLKKLGKEAPLGGPAAQLLPELVLADPSNVSFLTENTVATISNCKVTAPRGQVSQGLANKK